jgi:hypothetical protein
METPDPRQTITKRQENRRGREERGMMSSCHEVNDDRPVLSRPPPHVKNEGAHDGRHTLVGSQCVEIMRASKLAKEDIELIWDCVDIGNKEALTREEFQMMMELMRRRKSGLKIGPETVSDWRLEQLKLRRKKQQTTRQQPQRTMDRDPQHGHMMKELQPILEQRARHVERPKSPAVSATYRASDSSLPDSSSLVSSNDLIGETRSLLAIARQTDWTLRSVSDLETMIGRLDRLLEKHRRAEDQLDETLTRQRAEMKMLEQQERAASESATMPTAASPKASLKKDVGRLDHDVQQLFQAIRETCS